MRRVFLLTGLLLAGVVSGLAQSSSTIFHKAPPDVEEALRARISDFYSLYQQGKFRQAESLVTEESRDLYYNMQKAPIRSFQLENIKWGDDFKTADVLMSCLSGTARTAAEGIWVPVLGKWKLEKGQWFLMIKPRSGTPFGPMSFSDPRQATPQSFQRPTLEMLRTGGFRVDQQKLVFPQGERGPITRTATITNNMVGVLYLTLQDPKIPGLTVKLSSTNILPKEKASVEATYDPQLGKLSGTREVRLTLQPLNQEIAIQLVFE